MSFQTFHNNADEIIPNLWLGNFNSSRDINFLKNNHIEVIINCTKDLPFAELSGIYKYRVPVHDNLEADEITAMTGWLGKILPIIDGHYRKNRAILIHCAAGMQRSAIVMLSYLYRYQSSDQQNPKVVYNLIRKKRPITFQPSMNFKRSFYSYFGPNVHQYLDNIN
jgi:protein-tyrosine phosphatase